MGCPELGVFVEEKTILSVDHLGLKRFYFSSKWVLPSVLGQCCWRAHHSTMKPTPLREAGPKLLARGKGAEQKLRSWCRVLAAPQQPLSPLSCSGPSIGTFWVPPLPPAWPRPTGGGDIPGTAGVGPSPALVVTIPVLTRDVVATLSAVTADPGRPAPATLVPSERRATTSERQATGFVTCFETHPAWSLLFHYPKSQRNHPAGSISHRQPDSFLVLY